MIFYLLNKGQQTVKILNNNETVESNLDETINAASELKFSVPLQKRLDSNIYYVLIPTGSGNDFYMFKIISEDIQKDRVEYSAVESAYDELKSYAYIKDIRPNKMNAAQMLQQVLKNTRWSLGYVEDTGIQSSTFYYITVLEAIQKIVDLFKVELTFTIQLDPVTQQITGRKVNLYRQQGRRTGKRFEYGSNLLTVTREEDSQNLVTALVGRGKGIQVSGQNTEDTTDDGYGRRLTFADVEWKTTAGAPVDKPKGQEYVEDPKATALYGFSDGRPRIGLVTFEDIEDPNELLNATWSALLDAKRPKVSFKAEVTDVGDLQLGDTIAIIRHDLGIEYFTRVYKVHHNLKDENRNTVEMGDDFSNRSITSAISNAIQTSQDATKIANTAAIAANGKNRNFYSNTKPLFANEGDNLFLNLGNGETEMWVWHHGQWEFVQSTVELHTVQKEVKEAQDGLKNAKKEIADNLAKADSDIDELNASIRDQKGTIDGLSTTINTVAIPKITDVTNKVSDALTKINDQKNIVTGLQTQSAQQGKDISKITTDIHGVTVDLANINGDVNQTKATVQGLQSTLGNAQGDIVQIKADAKKLETSLSGKVDNSTYANFVSATNNALNAKLVASDLNGYAKTTDVQATANGLQVNINSVADRMNNLKIGAENLLTNTGDLKDYQTNNYGQIQDIVKSNYIPLILNHPELTHMGHIWTDWQSVYSNQEVILEKDKPYWFGFYVCTDRFDGNPFGKIYILGVKKGNDLSNSKVFVEQNIENYSYFGGAAKHWVWHTYKIIGDDEIYSCIRVEGNKSTGGSAYIAGYTLVQSDVAPTGHISSLEDTKHELSQLSAQITANNQKFSSYYTKVETDSKANTAKNDAISAIKNDGNWHGLTNILTNSGFLQTSDGFTQKVQQTTQPMINSANSGGVNLLVNTYNFGGFYSSAVDANGKNGLSLDEKDGYYQDRNYSYIRTKVAHVWGSNFRNAPLYFNQKIYLPAGTYTLSFLARTNGNNSNNANRISLFTSYTDEHGGQQLGDSDYVHDFWEKHQITFSINQNYLHNNIRLQKWNDASLPGGSIYFANLKLESGSLATTWCPAPEDYATQTSFSELNQTIKGLQSTVSSNYTNLQSQLSQTAGTISTVVGKVNNLEIATNVQIVDHGIDLNTYKSTGTWFVKGAGTNAPESTWFYLEVKTAWDGRVVQTWQRDDVPTDRYVRTYIDNRWSNWERSASYSEYSTLNQTVKGLQSTVSNNYTNLQSQISQTAGTIRSEITNKTTNLQSQITQNANNINIKVNAVGDLSNICLNPSFIDGSTQGWENVFSSSGDPGSPTKFYGGVSTRDAFYGNIFPVATGDKYFFSVFAWQNQSTHPFNVGLAYLQKDGSWNWQSAVNFAPNEGARTKSGSITIPNEAVKARIWVQIEAFSDYGHWWFTNLTVRKNDTISQINMSAGNTLIQNDKIYMDASSTVFSGKAFIPNAAITNISADKINTGTLDAGRINVINLNANNITTGTINGANLKINLNSGEILFQKGRIASTNGNLNIDINSGTMSVTNSIRDGVIFKDGKLIVAQGTLGSYDKEYGTITRSQALFSTGSFGMELSSPQGVNLKTSNYDGVVSSWSDWTSANKNGATMAVDRDGTFLMAAAKQGVLTAGNHYETGGMVSFNYRPSIRIGTGAHNESQGARISIEASYIHMAPVYRNTTSAGANVFVASDGALVRSTSASKYKTEIKRSYSTDYGEKLLNLPTATWIDKGQKERYEAGKRHIKPEKYFGMIAEDLADAGLDLLVSHNPLTHEIEGIQYERIAPALLPVIKKLKDKVNRLEKQINE